jgi:epoxyqueuosine reductase
MPSRFRKVTPPPHRVGERPIREAPDGFIQLTKRVCRHVSQEVCPWNEKFARELRRPAFAARPAIAWKDARALSCELLAMSDEDFRSSFKGSPMKRAKLRGLKRNAAVVLGNVGEAEDAAALTRSLGDLDPLVREHAAWALPRIAARQDR